MKIKCDREKLLHAFQTAATVAPQRSPKAVLQNVKLEAQDDQAVLIATDMEVSIRLQTEGVESAVPGEALLSVTEFGSILRESSDEFLTIESDGQAVHVFGERSKYKLPCGNPAEFPGVATFAEEKYHQLNVRLMKELIRRTLFATDNESSRYALGGILLEMDAEKITAVGTDGRRLAKMEGPAESVGGHESGDTMTIVPSRSMQLIERALAELDADVQVASRGNDFVLKGPNVTISTRLVEGRFPRWRDVLPHRPEAIEIEFAVGPVYSALRQAAVVARGESRGIDFKFHDGNLVLQALTADVGESRVELPVPYEGEEIILCLDHRFVADFLKVLAPDDTIRLNIVDSDSAALWQTNDGYEYVVMPLSRERSTKASASSAAV